MRRALSLIVLVILITYGVWYYLPPVSNSTIVMYRQPMIPGQTEGQLAQASPVMCISDSWRLSVEYLARKETSFVYSRLSRMQKATNIVVQLEHVQEIDRQTALSLQVNLTDDLGNTYVSNSPTEVTLVPQKSGEQTVWRLIFHFPGLNEKASKIMLSASLGQTAFRLPALPLR